MSIITRVDMKIILLIIVIVDSNKHYICIYIYSHIIALYIIHTRIMIVITTIRIINFSDKKQKHNKNRNEIIIDHNDTIR